MSVDGRIQLYRTLMSPADLAETFGPGLGTDAKLLQDDSLAARQTILFGTADTGQGGGPTVKQVMDAAPQVFSLNGQPSQVNGCKWSLPPSQKLGPPPVPTMPLSSPVVIKTPIGPATVPAPVGLNAPIWTNLCWALRNGAVDMSQFDRSEFDALQYRCMQLGYTGACVPPPNTQAYLEQNRRAGTLPHIQVTPDLLNGIPQAPDMTNVPCQESYRMAGLTGYAPSWSDALVQTNSDGNVAKDAGVGQWITDHPWLSLALAVGGAVALSRRQK